MERGTIALNNLELSALTVLAVEQGCDKQALLQKLQPVADQEASVEHTVLLSEDDAEILLDCMPIPGSETDPSVGTARIKVQQFLARSRFGEQAT
jgi:hypothetical protein